MLCCICCTKNNCSDTNILITMTTPLIGPNSQFRETLSQIMDYDGYQYDLAVIMEADMQVRRAGWLNFLLEDIRNKSQFAILGSKFKGKAWDEFKELMPQALLDHINGNAIYNLTNPLFQLILHELKEEAGTEWDAVPYGTSYELMRVLLHIQYVLSLKQYIAHRLSYFSDSFRGQIWNTAHLPISVDGG